jgi:ABC-2 type transport system permease protein
MWRKPWAFIKKDFQNFTSYKLALFFNFFGIFIGILSYFFIDKLFGQKMVPHLAEFGVNYFAYILLSLAFYGYIGVGLGSFTNQIRNEQLLGTLEATLLTPTKVGTILFSMALWNLLLASFDLVIYILLGLFLFKLNFSNINILSTLVILLLTIISFSGLGIISASFIIVFKRGNPLGWLINSVEGLISGVYFPVTVLPSWLQIIAKLFPITYAIRAIELAVYKGYSIRQLSVEIGALVFFSFLLLPLSLVIFKYALKRAKINGILAQY